jgi:hypothetical protein
MLRGNLERGYPLPPSPEFDKKGTIWRRVVWYRYFCNTGFDSGFPIVNVWIFAPDVVKLRMRDGRGQVEFEAPGK